MHPEMRTGVLLQEEGSVRGERSKLICDLRPSCGERTRKQHCTQQTMDIPLVPTVLVDQDR